MIGAGVEPVPRALLERVLGEPRQDGRQQVPTGDPETQLLAGVPSHRCRPQRDLGLDDLPGAIAQITDNAPVLLLAHEPDIFPRVPARVSLTLSGHTHGGQINWKLLVPKKETRMSRWLHRPSRKFMRGLAVLGNTQLYVNRGFGTVVVPLRYGCTPEITLIELQKTN